MPITVITGMSALGKAWPITTRQGVRPLASATRT